MLSVLYVDDENSLLDICKLFLERAGDFRVDTLPSAKAALEKLKTTSYDAIVADYQMPEMDGIQFLQVLRSRGNTTPFIIFTGRGREEVVIEALNNGADFYIQKGGDPKAQFTELTHKIRLAVQIKIIQKEMREIVEGAPIPEFVIDNYHRVIYWNRALEEYSGISASEVVGTDQHWRAFYTNKRPCMADLLVDSAIDQIPRWYEGKFAKSSVVADAYEATDFFPTIKGGCWLFFTAAPIRDTSGRITGAVETLQDITAIRQKEEELKAAYQQMQAALEHAQESEKALIEKNKLLEESEQRYHNVVETQTEFICRFLPDGTHIFVNDAYCRYFNKKRREIIGSRFIPKIPAEEQDAVRQHFASLTKDHPTGIITHRIIMPDGRIRWQRWSDRAIFNDTGSLVEYQSVGRDFTNLKLAEEALRDSEEGYRLLVESMTDGVVIHQRGEVRYANTAAMKIVGAATPSDFIGKPLLNFVHPDYHGIVQEHMKTATHRELPRIEEKFLRINGSPVDVEVSAVPFNYKGSPAAIVIFHDITNRKQTQEALLESEQRYRNVVEDQTELICRFLPDGTHVFVNTAYCRYFGLNCKEIIGKKFSISIPPDDREKFREHFASFTAEHPIADIEHRIILPDGGIRWMHWSDRAIYDADGRLTEYQSVGRDITGLKLAEEALKESDTRLNAIIQGSPIPKFVIDRDHRVIYWNKALEKYSGIKAEEITGTNQQWRAFYKTERPCMADLLVDGAIDKIPLWYEGKYAKSQLIDDAYSATDFFPHMGERGIWLYFTAAPIRDPKGNSLGAVETLEDVTDIHDKEKELKDAYLKIQDAFEQAKHSEEMYRNVVETQTEFICRFRPDGTHVFVNEAYCRYFKRKCTELIGKKFRPEIPPEDQAGVREHFASLKKDHPVSTIDHRIIMPDGTIRWQRWVDRAIFDEQGALVEYQTVGRDITERKRAEEALRESGQRYRAVFENTGTATVVVEDNTIISLANAEFERLTGFSKEEIEGKKSWTEFVVKEDLERMVAQHTLRRKEQGAALKHYEFGFVTRSGERRDIYLTIDVIPGTKKSVASLLDITERKQMEAEMKKSEEKYRSIIENIQDVYYRTDHDGNLIMASPSGLTLLGYRSFDELLGRPIAEALYHEPEKRRIFLAALHERGFVRNYEVVLREKDGTPVVVSTNSHYYYDTNGEIAGVEGVFQDITERKRAEAALYQANKKLTMLASITRHDIMNKITGLSISNDLAKNLTKNKKLLEILDTVDNTIRAIVRQIEFTRTYENLATSTPEWQSVNDIVSRAVAQFDLIGVTVTNETGGLEVYADPMLEKVFYNLTDNALRHGEKISEIKARYEKTGDGITIIFEDNGAGIPEPDKEEIFKKGYGKNSGLGLFISKEILAITGLSIRETGVPGEGARFEMTIPKRAYRLTTAD